MIRTTHPLNIQRPFNTQRSQSNTQFFVLNKKFTIDTNAFIDLLITQTFIYHLLFSLESVLLVDKMRKCKMQFEVMINKLFLHLKKETAPSLILRLKTI